MSRLHDAPEPIKPKTIKPGTIPSNKIAVLDYKGRMRGQVGKLATSATAARFTGTLDNKLTAKGWIGAAPSKPSMAQRQAAELRASLRTAKGSNKS